MGPCREGVRDLSRGGWPLAEAKTPLAEADTPLKGGDSGIVGGAKDLTGVAKDLTGAPLAPGLSLRDATCGLENPDGVFERYNLQQRPDLPNGIYEVGRALNVGLVVLPELPGPGRCCCG